MSSLKEMTPEQLAELRQKVDRQILEKTGQPSGEAVFRCPGPGDDEPCPDSFASFTLAAVCESCRVHVS